MSIFDNLTTLTKAKWKSLTRAPQHDSLPSLQFDILVWRQWKSLKKWAKSKNVSFKLKQKQEHTWLQQLNEENYDSWRPKGNGFIHNSWRTINFLTKLMNIWNFASQKNCRNFKQGWMLVHVLTTSPTSINSIVQLSNFAKTIVKHHHVNSNEQIISNLIT